MATAFAQQLRQIAAHSTNELDLKARRNAHAESLLFERSVAIKQDWDTLFQICLEGFQEICALDARFREFEANLFSSTSKSQDREQMNKAQNEDLDATISRCLYLLGPRLSLRPGLRALEWLVRRFRVHVHNVSSLLLTALRFHESQLFRNVLGLISQNQLTDEWKFLRPYHNAEASLPRNSIIYVATTSQEFFSIFNEYTLQACRTHLSDPTLMRFWGGIIVEATAGRLNQAKSGRAEVQNQRIEDVLHQVLPILSEGLATNLDMELVMTCFALALVIATTGVVADDVIDSMSDAISRAASYVGVDEAAALTVLVILAAQKSKIGAPRKVVKVISQLSNIFTSFENISEEYSCHRFFLGVIRTLLKTLTKSKAEEKLAVLRRVLQAGVSLQAPTEAAEWLALLVHEARQLESKSKPELAVRAQLLSLLQDLNDLEAFQSAFSELHTLCGKHNIILSDLLMIEVPRAPVKDEPIGEKDVEMTEGSTDGFETAVAALPAQIPRDTDFMSSTEPAVVQSLRSAIILCGKDKSRLEHFEGLPLWTANEADLSQYYDFLLRIMFGDEPSHARQDAMTLLSASLSSKTSHAERIRLLPYLSVLLSDGHSGVRRAAVQAVIRLQRIETPVKIEKAEARSADMKPPAMKPSVLQKVLDQIYLPNAEEFGTDNAHIKRVLGHAINGTLDKSLKSTKGEVMELQKSARESLLQDFSTCAARTPFLRFKVGMIQILDDVTKAGSIVKTDALMPLLKEWASKDSAEAKTRALTEGLALAQVDKRIASIIIAQERHSITPTLDFVESTGTILREKFVTAIFDRIAHVWKDLATESSESLAVKLFELSLRTGDVAAASKATLQQANKSSSTLQQCLENALSQNTDSLEQPPTKKRRTSSHGAAQTTGKVLPLTFMLRQSLPRLGLALDLVEASLPADHPSLLPQLTEVLLHLRRCRDQLQAESPYLISSCLSSMLAIVNKIKTSRRPSIDWTNVRADLIADCVRTSESSQVQTQALMLSASLAEIGPDKIIQHIMPVFTSLGSSKMVTQATQHSISVVNEAIDCIVPPLVATLRKQDAAKLLQSSKTILASFVASFQHIPESRKVPLFQRLLRQLDPAVFGFAIIALLVHRDMNYDLTPFLSKVFADFTPEVHLSTYRGLILLGQDCFAVNSSEAEILLEVSSSTSSEDRNDAALKMLSRAKSIIESAELMAKINKSAKLIPDDDAAMEELFRDSLLRTLEATQAMRSQSAAIQSLLGECLVGLLEMTSIRRLIKSLLLLFDGSNNVDPGIKAQAINLLSRKMTQKGNTDSETATAALEYLERLEEMVSKSDSNGVKIAAIQCIDRICTKYGRRDAGKLLSTAATLTGDDGIGSTNTNIQMVAAYTLSSLVATMKEVAVPIVPQALQGALAMIGTSTLSGNENPTLHNAAFALITSLVQSISFMLSEDDVGAVIVAAAECAFSELPSACSDVRKEAITQLAQQIELAVLLTSLDQSWDKIIEFESEGILSTLDILDRAVESHDKPAVVQSADKVSAALLKVFDLRRQQSSEGSDLDLDADELGSIEAKANEIAMKFIYKLNDGVFRPIFESWVEWAVNPNDLSETDGPLSVQKALRQTAICKFLTTFFSTLKSIVTSYASYLIKPANDALSEFSTHQPTLSASTSLYTNLLAALSEAFKHDADGFFTAPSHFEPLARNLVSQLELAATKILRPLVFQSVVPTIVALATAVQDTSSHHLSINHYLAQLRHKDSPHVRLASIRTHLALTEDEEIGDEWVNNVVSGTASAEDMLMNDEDEAGGRAGVVGGSGETMIYVNEMLEDDDEEVEREVRRWVRMVRERVGEDIFET